MNHSVTDTMPETQAARSTWSMAAHHAAVWRQAEGLARRMAVRKGSVIYHQGERIEQIYLVLEGEVELRSLYPDGDMAVFEVLGSNGMFGEPAALTGAPTLGTAFAAENCVLLCFNVHEVQAALPQHPELAQALIQVLAARQYTCVQRLLHVFRDEPWVRVGELLSRLLALHGKPVAHPVAGTELTMSLTHEDIARLTGLSRVSVTRVLKRMRDEAVISTVGRRILILDADRLRFN